MIRDELTKSVEDRRWEMDVQKQATPCTPLTLPQAMRREGKAHMPKKKNNWRLASASRPNVCPEHKGIATMQKLCAWHKNWEGDKRHPMLFADGGSVQVAALHISVGSGSRASTTPSVQQDVPPLGRRNGEVKCGRPAHGKQAGLWVRSPPATHTHWHGPSVDPTPHHSGDTTHPRAHQGRPAECEVQTWQNQFISHWKKEGNFGLSFSNPSTARSSNSWLVVCWFYVLKKHVFLLANHWANSDSIRTGWWF